VLGPTADQTGVWGRGAILSSGSLAVARAQGQALIGGAFSGQAPQQVRGSSEPVVHLVPEQQEYFHVCELPSLKVSPC
jgi:hypothetical protein